MKKFNSIIYVNYSPYENSGKILDYLLENFKYVFLFTLGFHNIKKKADNTIRFKPSHIILNGIMLLIQGAAWQ